MLCDMTRDNLKYVPIIFLWSVKKDFTLIKIRLHKLLRNGGQVNSRWVFCHGWWESFVLLKFAAFKKLIIFLELGIDTHVTCRFRNCLAFFCLKDPLVWNATVSTYTYNLYVTLCCYDEFYRF